MFKTDAVQEVPDAIGSKFAVIGCNREQLAAGKLLRGATFIDIDVRCFGADDCLISFSNGFQAQHVCAGPTKNKIDIRVFAKLLAKLRGRSLGIWIVTICDDVPAIRGNDGLQYLRMNTSVIVAGKTSFWFKLSGHHSLRALSAQQKNPIHETTRNLVLVRGSVLLLKQYLVD